MKILTRHCAILLAFCLVAMGPKASSSGGSGTVSPFEGDSMAQTKAPDFSLKDMNGRSVSLASLKGRPVILNFWATWCPPCKAEMPSLNKLYLDLKKRGLEVIAISTDTSPSHVSEFLSKTRLDFTIALDDSRSVSKLYKVFSMPTTFLINRDGTITEKLYGEYDWTEPEIRQKIEKLF